MGTELQKRCWRCEPSKALQPITNFGRRGKDSACRECRLELNKEWSQDHREELRDRRREYMRAYRSRLKAQKTNPSADIRPDAEHKE